MTLPKEGQTFPLWLLVAVKNSLFCCTEDPTLDDAHKVLFAIDEAMRDRLAPPPQS